MTEQDAIFTEQENAIFVIQALPHKIWEQMGPEEKKAIDMGIEALAKQMNSGWIPCSERLPDKTGRYITTNSCFDGSDVDVYDLYFSKKDSTWLIDEEDELYSDYVSAWQPLPEPYKAGE